MNLHLPFLRHSRSRRCRYFDVVDISFNRLVSWSVALFSVWFGLGWVGFGLFRSSRLDWTRQLVFWFWFWFWFWFLFEGKWNGNGKGVGVGMGMGMEWNGMIPVN